MAKIRILKALTSLLIAACLHTAWAQDALEQPPKDKVLATRQTCIQLAWDNEIAKETVTGYIFDCVNNELTKGGFNAVAVKPPFRVSPEVMKEIRAICLGKSEQKQHIETGNPVKILDCVDSVLDELGFAPPKPEKS